MLFVEFISVKHLFFLNSQFMDLRTRYTALVTLMTQYVKFASETLKRTEDEEVRISYLLYFLAFYIYRSFCSIFLTFGAIWTLKLKSPVSFLSWHGF